MATFRKLTGGGIFCVKQAEEIARTWNERELRSLHFLLAILLYKKGFSKKVLFRSGININNIYDYLIDEKNNIVLSNILSNRLDAKKNIFNEKNNFLVLTPSFWKTFCKMNTFSYYNRCCISEKLLFASLLINKNKIIDKYINNLLLTSNVSVLVKKIMLDHYKDMYKKKLGSDFYSRREAELKFNKKNLIHIPPFLNKNGRTKLFNNIHSQNGNALVLKIAKKSFDIGFLYKKKYFKIILKDKKFALKKKWYFYNYSNNFAKFIQKNNFFNVFKKTNVFIFVKNMSLFKIK